MTDSSTTGIQTKLNSITECSICTEEFRDPRTLPCFHSYCLKCLQGFSKYKQPGDDVACPLCRKKFKIPRKGVSDLPKNFFIEQLKDIARSSIGSEKARNTKSDEKKVDLFCVQHKEKVLELFCLDCEKPICALCSIGLHKRHECVDVAAVADKYRKLMTDYIKIIARSLAQCRELIERQKRSKIEFIAQINKVEGEISEQVERMKQRIDREKQTLMEELEVFKRERVELMDRMVDDTEQHAAFIQSLGMYTEELRNNGTASDVTQQMSSLHDRAEELMKLDSIQRAIDDTILFDVSFTAATQQRPSENSVGRVEIREQQKKPPVQSPPLQKLPVQRSPLWQQSSLVRRQIQNPQPAFTAATQQRPSENSVGRVDIREQQKKPPVQRSPLWQQSSLVRRQIQNPQPDKTPASNKKELYEARDCISKLIQPPASPAPSIRLTRVLDGGRGVRGMTSLDNRLLVLRWPNNKEIDVYDSTNFKQLQPIRIEGLGGWGLTSSVADNCLFVSDWRQSMVYKIELSARNKVSQWKVGLGPIGLSMNSGNNLLVTCYVANSIQEFTTSGSLVKEIVLNKSGVSRPWHTVELTNGQLVVSHRGLVHDEISVVNKRGKVVASSRLNLQSANKTFNDLTHLAACENGRILAADKGNDRIVELNNSITWTRDLSLPVAGGLQGPRCLYLDESRDRLYVGECDGERVLVFENVRSILHAPNKTSRLLPCDYMTLLRLLTLFIVLVLIIVYLPGLVSMVLIYL